MSVSLESYVKRYYTIGREMPGRWYAEKKELTPNSSIAKHLISETAGWKRRSEMMDFLKSKMNEVISNLKMNEGLS